MEAHPRTAARVQCGPPARTRCDATVTAGRTPSSSAADVPWSKRHGECERVTDRETGRRGDGETETERQTHRHTDTQTHRHTDTQTTEVQRQRDRGRRCRVVGWSPRCWAWRVRRTMCSTSAGADSTGIVLLSTPQCCIGIMCCFDRCPLKVLSHTSSHTRCPSLPLCVSVSLSLCVSPEQVLVRRPQRLGVSRQSVASPDHCSLGVLF